MNNLVERAVRAAQLDAGVYEEVEADQGALGQAMTVVVVSSLCAGIGSAAHGGVVGLVLGAVAALISWYIWAYLTYFIGTRFLPEAQTSANVGELLRTTGFSSSPGALRILGVIPGLMGFVFVVASIWMLVAMVVAVRQALDYSSTGRAIGVCIIGWLVMMAIFSVVAVLTAPTLGVAP